jgi:Tfp pilus assembly protein FimT
MVETTLVIALSSALAAVSLPRAWSFIDRIEVRGAVTEIEAMFSLARHTAIARGSQVSLDIDQARKTVSLRSGTETLRMASDCPQIERASHTLPSAWDTGLRTSH